jgi:hypothetical protein
MNNAQQAISRTSRQPLADPQVELDAGQFGAGQLATVSMMARGEARGHGFWIDRDLLAQMATALKTATDNGDGIKSRYTHPFASADSLGRFLGRVTAEDPQTTARGLADGWLPCTVHLAKTSRRTPEGDLGGYIMDLAREDSEALGLSAVFRRDFQTELEYMLAHGGQLVAGPDGQDIVEGFQSPDPENIHNLPHARLAELVAADVVGDPAANPSGLRGPVAGLSASHEIWRYALGLTDQRPSLVALDIDPDRLRDHMAEFFKTESITLVRNGAEIMTRKTSTGMASADASLANAEETTETPAETEQPPAEPEASDTAPAGDVEPITQDEPETPDPETAEQPEEQAEQQPQTVQLTAADLQQWQRLGPNAMQWLAEGKSLAEATALRLAEQDTALAERDTQLAELSAAAQLARGETEPVSGSHAPPAEPQQPVKGQDGTTALAAELDAKIQKMNSPSGN